MRCPFHTVQCVEKLRLSEQVIEGTYYGLTFAVRGRAAEPGLSWAEPLSEKVANSRNVIADNCGKTDESTGVFVRRVVIGRFRSGQGRREAHSRRPEVIAPMAGTRRCFQNI